MTDAEDKFEPCSCTRWVPAAVVIALGVLFLIANLGYRLPFLGYANWWAWFILIGAAWPLAEAAERYRRVGRLDGQVWHSLLSALSIAVVAVFFIAQLSWALWWPVFMILGGLYMLGGRRHRRDRHRDRDRDRDE